MADDTADGFLARWSRRKAQVRAGAPAAPEAPAVVGPVMIPVPAEPVPPAAPVVADAEAPPLPTLADVAALTHESDYSRFVATGVDETVKRAALKKLFTDPHFNVMDGLDTYIDDYGKPDPIPEAMLRQMNQSHFLGLFDDEKTEQDEQDAVPPTVTTDGAPPVALPESAADAPTAAPDENTDLQLQPDDAAGRPGPAEGTGPAGG